MGYTSARFTYLLTYLLTYPLTPHPLTHPLTHSGCAVGLVAGRRRPSVMYVSVVDSPGYKKTVPGEGMPHADDPSKKGDLVIEFNIDFPHLLTPDKRALVRKALPH